MRGKESGENCKGMERDREESKVKKTEGKAGMKKERFRRWRKRI